MFARWIVIASALVASDAYALEVSGQVSADGRLFFRAPRHLGQRLGTSPSMAFAPNAYLQDDRANHTLTIAPFLRIDAADSKRTHFDLRQADYVFASGGFTLGAGMGVFTDGVLDIHRVVDISNQLDLVEDMDGSQKLGQPYVSLGYASGDWAATFRVLPYLRARTFPGERGRLRFPLIVDQEQVLYESRLGAWTPSFFARVSGSFGPLDLGVSGFSGLSREPRFFGQIFETGAVVAQYDFLQQAATDVQLTFDNLVFKGEFAARWWSKDLRFFGAGGAGVAYHFFDVLASGADLSLLGEYHFDGRAADAPITFFDNDVAFALRLAINDTGDTRLTAGMVRDLANTTTYARARLVRRFGERWTASAEVRLFIGRSSTLESGLLDDDFAQGTLAYHF